LVLHSFKITGIQLELLSDPDMLMLGKGIRGGSSMIFTRYSKANTVASKWKKSTIKMNVTSI